MAALGQVGSMSVALLGDVSKFNRDMDTAGTRVKRFADQVGAAGVRVANAGKAMTLGITAPLIAIGTASVIAFDKQAKALAQVEAGIISTGGACGFTVEELAKIAAGLQDITRFGDEEILTGVTAQLLTFANIVGPQFERAQVAVMDLAARLGTDLKSAAIQVGKALNDPITGLSMLGRSGITFTDQQKEVIKSLWETGKQAEAQTVILEELEHQYGGSAEAAVTGAGKIAQLKNTVGDLSEEFGGLIMEGIEPFVEKIKDLTNAIAGMSTEQKEKLLKYLAIFAVGGPALYAVGTIAKLVPALYGLWAAISASPIGLMLATAAAALALNKAFVPLYDTISGALGDLVRGEEETIHVTERVIETFVEATNAAGNAIINNVNAVGVSMDDLVKDLRKAQADAQAELEAGTLNAGQAMLKFKEDANKILDEYGVMDDYTRGLVASTIETYIAMWAELVGVTVDATATVIPEVKKTSEAVAHGIEAAKDVIVPAVKEIAALTTTELAAAQAEFAALTAELANTSEGSLDYILVVGKIQKAYKSLVSAAEAVQKQDKEVGAALAELIARYEALGLVLEDVVVPAAEDGMAKYRDIVVDGLVDIAWDVATFHRKMEEAEEDHQNKTAEIIERAQDRLNGITESYQERREDAQLSFNRTLEDIEIWYWQQVEEGAADTAQKRIDLEAEKQDKIEAAKLDYTRRLEDLDIEYTRNIEDNEADREEALQDELDAYEEQRPQITEIVKTEFGNMVDEIVKSKIDETIQGVIDQFLAMGPAAESGVAATNTALAGLNLGALGALIPLFLGGTEAGGQLAVDLNEWLTDLIYGAGTYEANRGGTVQVQSYADGGVVPGPIGAPVPAIVHGGEPIGAAGFAEVLDYERVGEAVQAGTYEALMDALSQDKGRPIIVQLADGTRLAQALYNPLAVEQARRGG